MRLVDIDSLKGCAIIRPTSSEEIAHIQACPGLIAHKDIPTAYDVEAKVAELEKFTEDGFGCSDCPYEHLEKCGSCCEVGAFKKAIEIVQRKE